MMLPKVDVGNKRPLNSHCCATCRWWGKVLATDEPNDMVSALGRCTNLYNIALNGNTPVITGPFATCKQFEANEA